MNKADNTTIFSGFAEIYDKSRPSTPRGLVSHVKGYLERKIGTVVDIGCGTGLSITPWLSFADKIVGIEPNAEMLDIAKRKYEGVDQVSFLESSGENTELPSDFADVVTCVQAFHWLDAETAIPEMARILKEGGVLAALDNDFPPVSFWKADKAYEILLEAEREMEIRHPKLAEGHLKADKSNHLLHMKESGLFSYCREIVFFSTELCDSQRYIDLAYSQSPLQRILKADIPEMEPYISGFEQSVKEAFAGKNKEIGFCYRLRASVK